MVMLLVVLLLPIAQVALGSCHRILSTGQSQEVSNLLFDRVAV